MPHEARRVGSGPRTLKTDESRPYRVVAVSLYELQADIADQLAALLRRAGLPRANRSLVMREALLRLQEDLEGKSPADVLRYFVDRQAHPLTQTNRLPPSG